MEYCRKCGNGLKANAKFCGKCGTPVQNKDGMEKMDDKIRSGKCPYCNGELEDEGNSSCPWCGKSLQKIESINAMKDFSMKLDEIEKDRYLDNETKHRRKINLIKTYVVPNVKEDIREFLLLAKANMNPRAYGVIITEEEREEMDAWAIKFELLSQKARAISKNQTDLKWIEELRSAGFDINDSQSLENKEEKKRGWSSWNGLAKFGWVILNIYTYCIPLIIYYFYNKIRDKNK